MDPMGFFLNNFVDMWVWPQIEKTPHQLHQTKKWMTKSVIASAPKIFARQSMVTKLFFKRPFLFSFLLRLFRHKQRVWFYAIIAMGWLA